MYSISGLSNSGLPNADGLLLAGAQLAAGMPGASAPLKAAAALAGCESDLRLEKACQDFEAVFLSMLWKEMQKTTKTDLGGWDVFAEQAMGTKWSKSGGIGLAKVIYKSVSKLS